MKALLIIDVQNDYFAYGNNELVDSEKTSRNIQDLITSFRNNNLPIIYIQHIADEHAPFFAKGSKGSDIHNSILPRDRDTIVIKHGPDSFYQTNLQDNLKKLHVTEIVLCGMMTHMCVDTTVRSAYEKAMRLR